MKPTSAPEHQHRCYRHGYIWERLLAQIHKTHPRPEPPWHEPHANGSLGEGELQAAKQFAAGGVQIQREGQPPRPRLPRRGGLLPRPPVQARHREVGPRTTGKGRVPCGNIALTHLIQDQKAIKYGATYSIALATCTQNLYITQLG